MIFPLRNERPAALPVRQTGLWNAAGRAEKPPTRYDSRERVSSSNRGKSTRNKTNAHLIASAACLPGRPARPPHRHQRATATVQAWKKKLKRVKESEAPNARRPTAGLRPAFSSFRGAPSRMTPVPICVRLPNANGERLLFVPYLTSKRMGTAHDEPR
jgi:hypothetical protein